MERESFESEEIGALLNASFVSIKVDREERPVVDCVYMTFVQVRPLSLPPSLSPCVCVCVCVCACACACVCMCACVCACVCVCVCVCGLVDCLINQSISYIA